MKTFYGNYLGIVVNGKDPEQRGRCQIFIPHIIPSLDEGWRGEDKKITITGSNKLGGLTPDEIERLRKLLPWAECAAPIIGAGPAGHYLENAGIMSEAALNTGAGAPGTDIGDGYASDSGPVTGKLAGIQEKNADFAARLNGFQKEAGQNGINVEIVSGVRSTERQAQIKAQAIASGRSSFAAPAGGSYHEYGLAADIRATGNGVNIGLGSTKDVSTPVFNQLLQKYGLHRPLLNYANAPEPWHVEPSYTPTAGQGLRGSWLTNYKQFGFGGVAKPDVNPTFSPDSFVNYGQQMARDNSVASSYSNQGATTFSAVNQSRDQLLPGTDGPPSPVGSRLISLDFDGRGLNNGLVQRGALLIVPNDVTPQELEKAEAYISGVKQFMGANGVTNYPSFSGAVINGKYREGIKTSSQNGNGKAGYFHTEPFTKEDTAAFNAIRNNPAGYMSVVASTLGSIPGSRVIAPHTQSAQGTASNGYSETRFAQEILIPSAGRVVAQGIPGASGSSGVSFGGGSATRFLNQVGSATGASGFNSSIPNIGVFPWTLSQLAQQRPDLVSQGYLREVTQAGDPTYYNNSKWSSDKGPLYTVKKPLYAQFTYNGKTYGVQINDVGSAYGQATIPGQGNRLFDISEVGSLPGLLGLDPLAYDGAPGQNLTGITDFTIVGAYEGQALGEVGSGQEVVAGTSLPVVTPRDYAIAPGPNTNNIPTGMFGSAREGQLVWCFFQEGNPLFPVYFAASYGREEWQNMTQAASPSVGNGLEDTWAVNWKTEAGGLRFVQTRENANTGLQDDYVSEFYGQYGGVLRFKKEGSEFFQPFHHGQQIEGDYHDVTIANREQKTGGTDNKIVEGDCYVTIGDWSQQALEAAAERQKIINEAMAQMA